jgi:hypothetical protein
MTRAWAATLLITLSLVQSLIPFSSFQFAKNGVCVHPKYFLHYERKFTMRNVPGEGDCMFLAVALATLASMGLGGNDVLLKAISRETRQVVASVLQSQGNLVIQGNRIVKTDTLVQSAARRESLSSEEYLQLLVKEGVKGGLYGGGPELTVLSNILRRPISIYEIDQTTTSKDSHSHIQCVGVFGENFFHDPLEKIPDSAVLSCPLAGAYSWHLHILVVDVSGEEKHACVLLPQ